MLPQIIWIPRPEPSALRGLAIIYFVIAYGIYQLVKTEGVPSKGEQLFDFVVSAFWPVAFPLFIIVGVVLEFLDKRNS